MQENPATESIAVVNQAAGGNCVLQGGLGPTLLSRYTRDAIQQSGVKYVLIFEGVNDIGSAGTDQSTQTQIGDRLISAYTQIATDCKKAGIKVFIATITPFSGSGQSYSNPTRDATRQRINKWIMANSNTNGSKVFDAVIDFSKAVADPSKPDQLQVSDAPDNQTRVPTEH
jgi:lysophospholipase L1-like esterase